MIRIFSYTKLAFFLERNMLYDKIETLRKDLHSDQKLEKIRHAKFHEIKAENLRVMVEKLNPRIAIEKIRI